MSRKIDLGNPKSWSDEDKRYLFDRGQLPASMVDEVSDHVDPPLQYAQPLEVQRTIHEMGKGELVAECDRRGLKHGKNVTYETLIKLLEEDDATNTEDDSEDSDEDEDEDDDSIEDDEDEEE